MTETRPTMDRMIERVAVISFHSSPLLEPGVGDSGGMTVYVRRIAEALSRRGIATDIYTRSDEGRTRATELSPAVRVVRVAAGPEGPVAKEDVPDYVDQFVEGIRLFATAQHLRYHVIHSHYWPSGLAGRRLGEAWGLPLVHSHHTLGLVKNRELAPGDHPEPQSRVDGERAVIEGADVLVVSTDDEWQQLACYYGASHDLLKTIHPGVDHRAFTPGPRHEARLRTGIGEGLILLYVGRIQPLKGLDLAVRSVEQLVPALDERVSLVVVGGPSGPTGPRELARLQALSAELGVVDRVSFVGPKPHSSLPDYYRAADALVMCSHSESFGLAALEAHACGLPVVATATGGLSHIVDEGSSGFLVDTRDPGVFAARLKTLLSDPHLRSAFGSEAARRAESFSWERTADALLELYRCLAEREPELCTC